MKMKTNSLTVMLIRHLIILFGEKIINENENEILIYLNYSHKKTTTQLFNNS